MWSSMKITLLTFLAGFVYFHVTVIVNLLSMDIQNRTSIKLFSIDGDLDYHYLKEIRIYLKHSFIKVYQSFRFEHRFISMKNFTKG